MLVLPTDWDEEKIVENGHLDLARRLEKDFKG